MNVLIVEGNADLAGLWKNHLERQGALVAVAGDEDAAIQALDAGAYDVVVLNTDLGRGNAFAVADYAAFRAPATRVVFVNGSSFFSDGSIFSHSPNAAAVLTADVPPDDLAAVVDYHGRR